MSLPRLNTIATRLLLSHALAIGMTIVIVGVLVVVFVLPLNPRRIEARLIALQLGARWFLPSELPRIDVGPAPDEEPIFGLIIDPDGTIVQAQGATECRAGNRLATCDPAIAAAPPGERSGRADNQQWIQTIIASATGHRIVVRVPTNAHGLTLSFLGDMVVLMGILLLSTLPVALTSALLSRHFVRRITTMGNVSKRVASGELDARIHDRHQDELGELSRQFDTMAAALAAHITALRDLAQRNAQLTQQVEQSVAHNERIRLSRELHDTIAQRLFSLTASTSALATVIERDPGAGVIQAHQIAAASQHALLELRTVLTNLRPLSVEQYGLAEALSRVCAEWSAAQGIQTDCSISLSGRPILSSVENTVFRIVQEALHNVAKHTHATLVAIAVVEGRSRLQFSISDDGAGFDPAQTTTTAFGLTGMRERARAMGGVCTIESSLNGTTVACNLPLLQEVVV